MIKGIGPCRGAVKASGEACKGLVNQMQTLSSGAGRTSEDFKYTKHLCLEI